MEWRDVSRSFRPVTSLIQARAIALTDNSMTVPTFLTRPSHPNRFNKIVMIRRIFNIGDRVHRITRHLTTTNCITVTPRVCRHRTPKFRINCARTSLRLNHGCGINAHTRRLLDSVRTTVSCLTTGSGITPNNFNYIKFYFKNRITCLTTALPTVGTATSFCKTKVAAAAPNNNRPALDHAPSVTNALCNFFNARSPLVPLTRISRVRTTLARRRVPRRVFHCSKTARNFFYSRHCDCRTTTTGST